MRENETRQNKIFLANNKLHYMSLCNLKTFKYRNIFLDIETVSEHY